MAQVEVIGAFPVNAEEPVHLVEVWVRDARGAFKVGEFTQEDSSQPQSNWQVPYMEHILNGTGDEILADDYEMSKRPELWIGDVRIAFFFHYLDFNRPLKTPFGEVRLPPESKMPERLAMLEYEQP